MENIFIKQIGKIVAINVMYFYIALLYFGVPVLCLGDTEAKVKVSWEYTAANWDYVSYDSVGMILMKGLYDNNNQLSSIQYAYLNKQKNKDSAPRFEGNIINTSTEPNLLPEDIIKTDTSKGFEVVGSSRNYVLILFSKHDNDGKLISRTLYSYRIAKNKVKLNGTVEISTDESPHIRVYKNSVLIAKSTRVKIWDIRLRKIKKSVTAATSSQLEECEQPMPKSWENIQIGETTTTVTIYK